MDRGYAKEAAERFPSLPLKLGGLIRIHGNHVHYLTHGIHSFPVKHHWKEDADLNLIKRSAQEIQEIASKGGFKQVIIPRPGCGCGNLGWEDVKKVLESILDDRFYIITKEEKVRKKQYARL